MKKEHTGTSSGLNPPLLALLVDLRYSISIPTFVCRLVVAKNMIFRQLTSLPPPLATPLSIGVYNEYRYLYLQTSVEVLTY